MVTVAADPGPYNFNSTSLVFSTATKSNDFLQAFGNGTTNEHPQQRRRNETAANTRGNDNASARHSGSTRSSSTQVRDSAAGSPTMAGWASDMSFQYPLSPPDSATAESKEWPFHTQGTFPPSMFTDLQSDPTFATEYGQITPPDDESENGSVLDAQLQEHQHGDLAPSSAYRGHTDHASPARKEAQKPSPKRTRKYTPRNSKQDAPDPNNPGDVRRSKFLERNRLAAAKCREKKKEWTQNLEVRARDLQTENKSLHSWLESLNDELFYLKNQITEHKSCDCRALQEFMSDPAHQVSAHDSLLSQKVFGHTKHGRTGSDTSHGLSDQEIEIIPKVEEIANDERTLEALLTSSINHDTSQEGIARQVNG